MNNPVESILISSLNVALKIERRWPCEIRPICIASQTSITHLRHYKLVCIELQPRAQIVVIIFDVFLIFVPFDVH